MATRVHVALKDFLRVTVKQREDFDTPEKAATELGFTSVDSFKQRLTKERKAYPTIFESVPKYTSQNGPKRLNETDAVALLAELDAELDGQEEESDAAE